MHERVNSIFIGVMTKQYARDNDIIETSEYKKFLKELELFSLQVLANINASVKK